MASQRTLEGRITRKLMPVAIVAIAMGLLGTLPVPARAQSFSVLYNFTGGSDGGDPYAGVTMDGAGRLYGTTSSYGYSGGGCDTGGCGTVFRLTHTGSGWTLNPLYVFQGYLADDGAVPTARVVFGPDGSLYGTTSAGGAPESAYGTVFNLRPPAAACKTAICPWTETVLHHFQGNYADGAYPGFGDVVFDQSGNLYGTTTEGGGGLCNDGTCGTVYKVSPSNGGWTENIIFAFANGGPGYWPYNGVIFDKAGNLYGATTWNYSGVYELTPDSGSWTESTLFTFSNQQLYGGGAEGGLVFDQSGNLYGTTSYGGPGGGGTVFELSPSEGSWKLTTLHSFAGSGPPSQYGPTATLAMDAAGNLYGTTYNEGLHAAGSVFRLSPSGGGWIFTSLYDFTGGSDGDKPYGQLFVDGSGKLYGTTVYGGTRGYGVVFEITP